MPPPNTETLRSSAARPHWRRRSCRDGLARRVLAFGAALCGLLSLRRSLSLDVAQASSAGAGTGTAAPLPCAPPTVPSGAGECVSDVMDLNAWLPPRQDYAAYRHRHEDWGPHRRALWAKLDHLQRPVECAGGRQWHLLKFTNHGFAYNLFNFVHMAARHWDNGFPVLTGASAYRFHDARSARGWTSFMRNLSSCGVDDVGYGAVVLRGKYEGTLEDVCRPHGVYDRRRGGCDCAAGYFPWENPGNGCHVETGLKPDSLEEFCMQQHRRNRTAYMDTNTYYRVMSPGQDDFKMGMNELGGFDDAPNEKSWIFRRTFFWWHAQHLWYLVHDAPDRSALDAWRAGIPLSPTCLAVHVRHGDTCNDVVNNHKVCRPWSEYERRVDEMIKQYGIFDDIYLATDDPDVLDEARRGKYASRLRFQRDFRGELHGGDVDGDPRFEEEEHITSVKRDIWALASCQAFVGTMSSSVAWIAYELMVAQRGHYVPFISLDFAFNDEVLTGRFRIDDDAIIQRLRST